MKKLLPVVLLLLTFALITPLIAIAATPSKHTLKKVTLSLTQLEKDLKEARDAYERYDKAGKLYEPSSRFLKACELIEKMEEAVNEPSYNYRNAIKGGWTKDNPEMKKCLDRVYEFYTGKAKIPDGHFIQYMDEPKYPESDTLEQMCDIMRAAHINAREKGIEAADQIHEYLMQRDKRHKRMMEGVKKADLDGSTRYNTANLQDKPIYKRAMVLIDGYEELCDKVLADVKVKRDAVREEMKKLKTIYTEMYELLLRDISNENYSRTEAKFADALDKFETDLWLKHGAFIEGLAKKWAPKGHTNLAESMAFSNEVNATVGALLGREYNQATQKFDNPGGMVANIMIRRSYIPKIRKASSMDLLGSVKRNIDTVKHLAENLQSDAFRAAVEPLTLVFRFDPDNKEAKELQSKFKDKLAKLDAELAAKIDGREWTFAHGESAPTNAVELAEKVWAVLMKDETWTKGKRHVVALKVTGDWHTIKYNILKQPTLHGLPVSIIAQFDDQKGKDMCWDYRVSFLTKFGAGVKAEPPFTHHGGASRKLLRLSKIQPGIPGTSVANEYVNKQIAAIGATTAGSAGGGSATGPIGWAVRLGLSILLVAAGLLAAASVITPKVAALKDPLSKLKPHSALIGVITLAAGLVSFILALLSFSPLAHILPQVTAVAVGLLLGKTILLKKSEKAPTEEAPVAPEEDKKAKDGEAKPSEELADKAAEVASKAADATEEAAKAAQDLLIKNKELFDKLEKVQVPIGFASIVFGVLHLLLGCCGFF